MSKPVSPAVRLKELRDMMKSVREKALLCEECRGRNPICEIHEDMARILNCREMEILDDLSWFRWRLEEELKDFGFTDVYSGAVVRQHFQKLLSEVSE